jgi:hypothetical protein
MSEYICGLCDHTVYLDDDHVEVDAETVWFDDRNETDTFLLHVRCADLIFSGWSDPA